MAVKQSQSLTAAAVQQGVLDALKRHPDLCTEPNFPIEPCHRVKEGCHHEVWRLGSHFLHALLTTPTNIKSLEGDRAVTKLVQSYSNSPEVVSVPSKPFKIGSWTCTIQKCLPGISLESYISQSLPLEAVIDNMTQFMRTLRSIPYPEAMEATSYEHERPNMKKRIKKALRQWEELRNIDYVRNSPYLILPAQPQSPYTPVLLHGDLSIENILVCPDSGNITGVIDWSDSMLGDPCEDIAGLALSLGTSAARKISEAVDYDKVTIERGLLFGKCVAIEDLWGLKCGDPEQRMPPEEMLRAQFRMAFEGLPEMLV